MYRSLFSRYLTAFLLIIVVAFSILVAVIGSMLANYIGDINRETLSRTAVNVKEYIESEYHNYGTDDFSLFVYYKNSNIKKILSMMSTFTDETFIFITDKKGTIVVSSNGIETVSERNVGDDIMSDIENGKISPFKNLSIKGITKSGCNACATAIVSKDGDTVGALFVCTETSATNVFVTTMTKTLIMECLWVLLAALIAVYFISERITRPLKEMSLAAKSFASGQFDVRVPVIGHNEVADLAQAFNNMAGSLAKTEEMRRSFIANVSHDLRTPMTTIAGFIDGILDGAIPPEKHEYYLGIIASEIRRLSRLVTTLLDITRIQAGERKFNMEPFDICEMARVILISFEQRINEKKLDVSFDCDNENMYVMADRDAIYQILYNICDNAVKFSFEGGKYRISIITKAGKVYISVYNEGQGISEDEISYVFDRFYKSDKSRGLDKTGTGLGLYIAKTIINAHHEEIWVRSVYGKFCEFTFTLPFTHKPKDD